MTPTTPLAFIRYVVAHCSTRMKMIAVGGIFAEIAAVTLDLTITSWMFGRIVGAIAANKGDALWQAMQHELVLLVILWTIRNFFYRAREWTERHYVPELMNMTRSLLFNRLIQQSQSFLHGNFAGVLANHVRRAGDVVGSLRDKMQYNIIPLIVRFAVACVLLWSITPMLAAFIMAFIVLCIASAVTVAPSITRLSHHQADVFSRLSGYIVDGVTNLSVVQQNVGWREEQARMNDAHHQVSEGFFRLRVFFSWFWGVFDTVMTVFFCGFMLLVAYGHQHGTVTTAQLAMTVGLMANLFTALAGTVSLLGAKFDDIGILKDALHKISTPLSIVDKTDAVELKLDKGGIEFRDVTFGYGAKPVFENLNLTIKPGEKIGLVGVSGAGKTTLCQLLLRSYDVQGGGVYIDGQNIADVTQDSLRANIAVIAQDPVLFHRTLRDNIRYGRAGATDEEVRAAAQSAEALAFIDSLPQGFDTLVGERGIKLSGGQRQRVAIARAIIRQAPILILDEATSALDSETERDIQTAMLHAMEGRTTIVVAHRLSTLSRMDRIVVMEHGKVVEQGDFNALKSSGGIFSRLWALQAGGFLPEALPEEIA